MDLIVNADDLGINQAVNEATFELIGQGKVTSSTIIANGLCVEEACDQIGKFPNCSFGAHLNVTEFQPLSRSEKLAPLLDGDGNLIMGRAREVPIDSSLAEGIFEEFCAQIDRLTALGVHLSHLDSHNYVLSMPKMFPILKRVQKKYQIRKVRISRNIYSDGLMSDLGLTAFALGVDPNLGDQDVSKILRIKKYIYNLGIRHYYRTKTSDGFSGFRLFYEYAKSRPMKHRTFEVNVHPTNPYYEAGETEILKGRWQEEIDFPIRLISYHEL
ncbi:ChbG/HpnK family deacetylase [SAR202 cluster bacterium AD-802-F09_MRT_200m]|nr:ChbG/HpnK family deacetylase [SAR202 cluster bacterium AD-802-F09_MRT_200m]